MIEIFTCDQCGETHQKYIKIQKVELSNKTKPKYFDSTNCAVDFLIESAWKQYKIDCTVQADIILIIAQLNKKRKEMEKDIDDQKLDNDNQ